MRARSLLVPALLALVAAPAARGEDAPAPLDPKDAALVARIIDALPPGDRKLADVVKAFTPSSTPEDRDLDFGVRSTSFDLYGESLTAWVRLLVYEDRVAAASVRFSTKAEGVTAFRAAVTASRHDAAAFKARGTDGVEWFDGPRLTALRTAVRTALGVVDRVDRAPSDLQKALLHLHDPLASHAVGTGCGEDGQPPSGREALELLVKGNSATLLESALMSPSPEGRVYAAEGLLRIRKTASISREALAAIERIRSAPTPIVRCQGCEFDRTTAAVLLEPFSAK